MSYLFYFALAALLALILTPLARRLAFLTKCVDQPKGGRKIHTVPMPLLGGLVIIGSLGLTTFTYIWGGNWNFQVVPERFIVGILLGTLVLLIGGVLDDRFELPAKYTWISPALATLIVLYSGVGVGIKFITNPLGGNIALDFNVLGLQASGIFVFCWLMGMTYTTKFLDGLDGLAAGVSLIAGLVMFTLSVTERINQPVTAFLAIALVGSLAGYLVYAFNPAKIFLGETGSTFLGWFLGILAVLTGAKIATAVLVMAIPILDVGWSIVRRLASGQSPFKADRKHLHFRLLDAGLSQRQAVLVFYGISLIFGFSAIALQSMGKLVALMLVIVAMLLIIVLTLRANKGPKTSGLSD